MAVKLHINKFIVEGPLLITPKTFKDHRGYFTVTYEKDLYKQLGVEFVQDNESFSYTNTIRGLHYQKDPHAQGKLVRVAYGKIMDYAVDIREGSPTFGTYVAAELSSENQKQLWIPPGFAHGFLALEDSVVNYKATGPYVPEADAGIRYDDPDIGIDWGIEYPILSDKDRGLPDLKEINLTKKDDA